VTLLFAFFSGAFVSPVAQDGVEEEEEEELEAEDESVKEGDLSSGQTRTPVLVRLLLAFAGTLVLKHGSFNTGFTGSVTFAVGFSVTVTVTVKVPVGKELECSEKESSTK
jgi:hypothetical protein